MSVLLEQRPDGVAIVRIDRPERRNALDSATLAELNRLLAGFVDDADLRAVVLSTTSTRALCAGADVGEELDHDAGVRRMEAFAELYRRIEEVPVPTIAVCVGNCVGAGAEIVAGADLRVAGDNLGLAWAGARLGVPVGPARLAPLVGLAKAKELVYTGRVVRADEALALGLATRVVPADEAEEAALELAAALTAQSPQGLRTLKSMFREFEGTLARVDAENERLVDFQRHGAGLPQG